MRLVHATALAAGSLAAVAEGAACLEQPTAEELVSQEVIVTQLQPGTDFGRFETFAITDSIPILRTFEAGASSEVVPPSVAVPTLDEIASQLTTRGFRRIDRSETPDLGVAVTAVVQLRSFLAYGSWWGVGAAAAGYWGVGATQFSSGLAFTAPVLWQSATLVIELYDLRDVREGSGPATDGLPDAADAGAPPIPVVWSAFVHGVLGQDAALPAPPIDGIRQAFTQSPYLHTP